MYTTGTNPTYYAWWTVTVEEDQLNTKACSPGAFIQQLVEIHNTCGPHVKTSGTLPNCHQNS